MWSLQFLVLSAMGWETNSPLVCRRLIRIWRLSSVQDELYTWDVKRALFFSTSAGYCQSTWERHFWHGEDTMSPFFQHGRKWAAAFCMHGRLMGVGRCLRRSQCWRRSHCSWSQCWRSHYSQKKLEVRQTPMEVVRRRVQRGVGRL